MTFNASSDSFKGMRNREMKSSELHSTKLNSDYFPPIANVRSQHSPRKTRKPQSIINTQQSAKRTSRPVVYPNKYFLLVSPCLSMLRGEEPSSDTDYSSDSEDNDRGIFDIAQPDQLSCATHPSADTISTERQEQVGSEQKSCDVGILNEDVDELYIQLAKLGLPTAFGSVNSYSRLRS
ncbi:hypothetical protein FBUS_05437 [Fasciolopsis buskii]|uniref:Uncharacterized protein n=1 Tax=Fasciolopsis buskii TaxID=27845 RepID=A0A8E0S0S0_9TREM|nr:hypothetical protein FBUS_05437 [Fasciolopsis buski]